MYQSLNFTVLYTLIFIGLVASWLGGGSGCWVIGKVFVAPVFHPEESHVVCRFVSPGRVIGI